MASYLSLRSLNHSHFRKFRSRGKRLTIADAAYLSKVNGKALGKFLSSKKLECFVPYYKSSHCLSSSASPTVPSEETGNGNAVVAATADNDMEYNRVNCLVWVLHESAASFSLAAESLELVGSGMGIATAWNGKDVHEWHKGIAYQVAVYALLKTAIEVEILLSHDRHNNPSPVKKILTPNINLLKKHIESQLSLKHPELVQWFRVVELPRTAGFFVPLLKKWSIEYAGSGVAGIIVAISCCVAVEKLGPRRVSSSNFTSSMKDVLIELMDLCHGIVQVDKLHKLATEAGFELNFLFHFGSKVLPCNTTEELELWIGLAHKKLSAAFENEIIVTGTESCQEKDLAGSLATLGLFSYLGRKTRLHLSVMNIKDLDDVVKDFLSYLECGSIFVYPELASVSAYQCFMDVVAYEIEWLDFYASCSYLGNQEREKTIQAEKEIILHRVFTVCYDVFSGFAHFNRSTQQPLDAKLLAFLLRSQSLLSICLEDLWAVYDRSCDPLKIAETGESDHMVSVATECKNLFAVGLESQRKPTGMMLKGCLTAQQGLKLSKQRSISNKAEAGSIEENVTTSKPTRVQESLLKKYTLKLASTSTDVWMGTKLLFVDIMCAVRLFSKQLHGQKVTERERKKLRRTLNDMATLVPVTIMMLIPVSAIGHAAMLAAVKKYMPFLIPSPYSDERLDVVKQLKRTKKMEVEAWSKLEDVSSKMNLEDPSSR